MPYEVPGFYAADKYVNKPLFGGEKDEGPKRKWYDPARGVDFAKGIAKAAALQFGGFMLPSAALGASKASSLNFYNTMTEAKLGELSKTTLGQTQRFVYEKSLNLKGILQEVGQDVGNIFEKSVKFGERSTGAIATAFLASKSVHSNPVADLYSQRHGIPITGVNKKFSRKNVQDFARDVFRGDKEALNRGINDNAKVDNLLDLIPGYKSVRQGFNQGYKQYKNLGFAQKYIDNPGGTYNEVMEGIAKNLGTRRNAQGGFSEDVINTFKESIKNVQRKRRTNLFDVTSQYVNKSESKIISPFVKQQRGNAYKDRLKDKLIQEGVDSGAAESFARNISVTDDIFRETYNYESKKRVIESIAPSERLRIGKDKIQGENFFQQLIDRYNGGKIGKNVPLNNFTGNKLEEIISDLDNELTRNLPLDTATTSPLRFLHEELLGSDGYSFYTEGSIKKAFESQITGTALNPIKSVIGDVTGEVEGSLKDELAKKAGRVLGLKSTIINGEGGYSALRESLAARGLDPDDAVQLKAFLLKNKAIARSETSGVAGFFGLKGLSVDKFIQRERSLYDSLKQTLGESDKDVSTGFLVGKSKEATEFLGIKSSIEQSNVKGYYELPNGKVLNLNPIKNARERLAKFAAEELKTPVVGINPLQLLGFKDLSAMSKAGKFQITPGNAAHPFIGGPEADFYTWHSTGGIFGTKGKLFAHNINDHVNPIELPGFYRPLGTDAKGMVARTAELATGSRVPQSRTATTILGKAKERLSYDSEQPNSLFRFFGRLVNRQSDIENEAVMSALIKSETGTEISIGGFGKRQSLELRAEKTAAGEEARFNLFKFGTDERVADHSQLMEAFTRFADKQLSYGMPKQVIRKGLEDNIVDNIGISANILDQATNPARIGNILEIVEQDIKKQAGLAKEGKLSTDQLVQLRTARSRLRPYGEIENLSEQSRMFQKSSSIVTRKDEFSHEIFRYLLERQAILSSDPTEVMTLVREAIDELSAKGLISVGQRAEAQASALSTVLNMSAFTTYKFDPGTIGQRGEGFSEILLNPLNRFKAAREVLKSNSSFLDPHLTGSIESTGQGIINKLPKIAPAFKKNLGMGKYVADPVAGVFGGQTTANGQGFTYIPTFATALKRNPKATLLSAAGIKTYGNSEGFSLASVPMSHGFSRLNKFFGVAGAELNADNFHGPLDLYMRGMNAQRILPAAVIGTTALALDRTLGGFTHQKDSRGENVYHPFVMGKIARVGVEAQAAISGITPGGMTYGQKRQQLLHGEVPIRKGRFWPLGNTPFKGGKIEYYRPSWYRRFQAGAMFTSDTYGSPIEKLMYYNDFSPLRPLDPYRFERKHYQDRPYPITGEYFSGPFGAAVPILNATIGRILKPQKVMHKMELDRALSSYVPVGDSGAYLPQESGNFGGPVTMDNPNVSYASVRPANYAKPLKFFPPMGQQGGSTGNPIYVGQGRQGRLALAQANQYASSAAAPLNTARKKVRLQSNALNDYLASAAYVKTPTSSDQQMAVFGPPTGPGIMPEKIVSAGLPIRSGSNQYLAGEAGYRLQETFGIYGFGLGNIRKSLGFGSYDFEPDKSVLQSAAKAYGTTRAFWDLNLGGLGDVPTGSEGPLGNIEASEIIRRFIPKERTNVNFINPIKNKMGQENLFLPSSNNFIDFTTGDPFTKVKEGELRLPGVGYERLNKLYSDKNGRYGAVNQLDILADVAPYSKEFKTLNNSIDKMGLSEEERNKVGQIRAQLNAIEQSKTDFAPYDTRSVLEKATHPISSLKKAFVHTDNALNNKFTGRRTATEDWERKNVYGSTFPEWQRPVESFIKPIYYKGTQRNPLLAAGIGAFAFGLFGDSPVATTALRAFGALTVGGYSAIKKRKEERFIPLTRKKQLALDEYADILTYVKNRTAASRAEKAGDIDAAKQFINASKRTMYGADLDTQSIDTLAAAVPKRKRDYFRAMIEAPPKERGRILSTAGRLERRLYEAAWGMPVERKPDLTEYFKSHELPGTDWEGWHPNTNMEHVKIKMGQSMGLEMSQMGYFPQQIKEANLTNPSYPTFGKGGSSAKDTREKLQRLMFDMGISGKVTPTINNANPNSINILAGIRG